ASRETVAWAAPPEACRGGLSRVSALCPVSTIHRQRLSILTIVCLRGPQEGMQIRAHPDPHTPGVGGIPYTRLRRSVNIPNMSIKEIRCTFPQTSPIVFSLAAATLKRPSPTAMRSQLQSHWALGGAERCEGQRHRGHRDHAGVEADTRRAMRHVTPQDPTATPGFFASLGSPDYCLLWGATACGQAAAWALVVLRAALVYELTRSNAWVGFVTMAAQLPSLVVTPFAGLLADRFDRRRVLACTFTLNLLNNLLLALLVLSGQITPMALLGIALINGILRATEMPTTQALLPNLVPGHYL